MIGIVTGVASLSYLVTCSPPPEPLLEVTSTRASIHLLSSTGNFQTTLYKSRSTTSNTNIKIDYGNGVLVDWPIDSIGVYRGYSSEWDADILVVGTDKIAQIVMFHNNGQMSNADAQFDNAGNVVLTANPVFVTDSVITSDCPYGNSERDDNPLDWEGSGPECPAAVTECHSQSSLPNDPNPTYLYAGIIACDADYEFFVRHGSNTQQTINAMIARIEAINIIFERELGLKHYIGDVRVRTNPNTPYPINECTLGSCPTLPAGSMIRNMRIAWLPESNFRNAAYLFSGKKGGVGTQECTLCNDFSPHGIAGFNFFSYADNDKNYGVAVWPSCDPTINLDPFKLHAIEINHLSHEFGHMWGSQVHCSAVYNPWGTNGCGIMSDNVLLSGPNSYYYFNPGTAATLRCIAAAPSSILAIDGPWMGRSGAFAEMFFDTSFSFLRWDLTSGNTTGTIVGVSRLDCPTSNLQPEWKPFGSYWCKLANGQKVTTTPLLPDPDYVSTPQPFVSLWARATRGNNFVIEARPNDLSPWTQIYTNAYPLLQICSDNSNFANLTYIEFRMPAGLYTPNTRLRVRNTITSSVPRDVYFDELRVSRFCRGDLNRDGLVDSDDLDFFNAAFQNQFGTLYKSNYTIVDWHRDGFVTGFDILSYYDDGFYNCYAQ